MSHNLTMLKLYFSNRKYWKLSDNTNNKVSSKSGKFFLNLKDRLEDNHYDIFDVNGLPVRMKNNKKVYNYTTICSYALANWQLYLETGIEDYTIQLFKTIEFLKENNESTDYGGIVFPLYNKLSSMNQGEALSVLARGYELTKNEDYISLAKKIILPYDVFVEDYGVKGRFKNMDNVFWYEEYAEIPHIHVLNGMIYSLVGLWEINQIKPELINAKQLFDKGILYLEQVLPLYDTGKWSWYWLGEKKPNYMASVMYHNLHVCQLKYLNSITGSIIIKKYADEFEEYSNRTINRILSGFYLLKGKIGMK